jgi:acetamidase/formamidase
MSVHEIPLTRAKVHGHFSRDLAPVLTVDPGDVVRLATWDAGWGIGPPAAGSPVSERPRLVGRDAERDNGHPLVGPIEVRAAREGTTLVVELRELRVGSYGFTDAGGWSSSFNDRLGVSSAETHVLDWELDAEAGTGRDQRGRTVRLLPFLGVLGMPPPEPGVHSTGPPRRWGGNIDCKELVAGSTLFLPIPVDGALFSAGDGHARQGDGEVSGLAIECPMERVELTIGVRDDLRLSGPIAETPAGWITFGFDVDLDEAAAIATEAMLDLIVREVGVDRVEALALASVVVDLRVTQVVNGVRGVHALLRRDAIAFGENPG